MGQLTRDQTNCSQQHLHTPSPPTLYLSAPFVQPYAALIPGRDYADTVVGGIYARWKSRYGAFVGTVVK